jgi:hypothetical protein
MRRLVIAAPSDECESSKTLGSRGVACRANFSEPLINLVVNTAKTVANIGSPARRRCARGE